MNIFIYIYIYRYIYLYNCKNPERFTPNENKCFFHLARWASLFVFLFFHLIISKNQKNQTFFICPGGGEAKAQDPQGGREAKAQGQHLGSRAWTGDQDLNKVQMGLKIPKKPGIFEMRARARAREFFFIAPLWQGDDIVISSYQLYNIKMVQ